LLHTVYRTLIGNHRHAIDRKLAIQLTINPTALTQTVQTFRKRRAGLSATAGLSCFFQFQFHKIRKMSINYKIQV